MNSNYELITSNFNLIQKSTENRDNTIFPSYSENDENSQTGKSIEFMDNFSPKTCNNFQNGQENNMLFNNINSLNQGFNCCEENSLQNLSECVLIPLSQENFRNIQKQPSSCQKSEKSEELINQDKKTDYTSGNKKKKCGRKTSKENSSYIHDKYKGDNIMRKIKVHIIQEKIIKLINNYFRSKKLRKKKLCKLYQKHVTRLKKDINLKLMNMTLAEIYKGNQIGTKYNSEKANNNKKLIDEIYNNSEYFDLQELLNLTFLEFYEIYTHRVTGRELSQKLSKKKSEINLLNDQNFKGIEEFINQLSKKEKDKGMSDDELNKYINEVKKYCGSFKEWFVNKKGRNE